MKKIINKIPIYVLLIGVLIVSIIVKLCSGDFIKSFTKKYMVSYKMGSVYTAWESQNDAIKLFYETLRNAYEIDRFWTEAYLENMDLNFINESILLVARVTEAEAGNQPLIGKKLVADVIYNRVDSEYFPDSVFGVIYQRDPAPQFSVCWDGGLDKIGLFLTEIDPECLYAAISEYEKINRIDPAILYFATEPVNGNNHYKYGDHWFSE